MEEQEQPGPSWNTTFLQEEPICASSTMPELHYPETRQPLTFIGHQVLPLGIPSCLMFSSMTTEQWMSALGSVSYLIPCFPRISKREKGCCPLLPTGPILLAAGLTTPFVILHLGFSDPKSPTVLIWAFLLFQMQETGGEGNIHTGRLESAFWNSYWAWLCPWWTFGSWGKSLYWNNTVKH